MIGAASESLILEIRDVVCQRLAKIGQPEPKGLSDWRLKVVLDALTRLLESNKGTLPKTLREEFESYWLAFIQQIRVARNEAGHPSSVDPVTEEGVHASFLMFPSLARLSGELGTWIQGNLK
jgi:hypothetical protein